MTIRNKGKMLSMFIYIVVKNDSERFCYGFVYYDVYVYLTYLVLVTLMLLTRMLNKVVDDVRSWALPLKPRPLGVQQELLNTLYLRTYVGLVNLLYI